MFLSSGLREWLFLSKLLYTQLENMIHKVSVLMCDFEIIDIPGYCALSLCNHFIGTHELWGYDNCTFY